MKKKDRKHLKKWRRQDRKQRGDMTFMDWLRMVFGRQRGK